MHRVEIDAEAARMDIADAGTRFAGAGMPTADSVPLRIGGRR
jgi:hypothetical protein